MFRVGIKGHWGGHCSSGFLKDLLDDGTNTLRPVVVCIQGLWDQAEPGVGAQPKKIYFFFLQKIVELFGGPAK